MMLLSELILLLFSAAHLVGVGLNYNTFNDQLCHFFLQDTGKKPGHGCQRVFLLFPFHRSVAVKQNIAEVKY